jgi:hypothetical protein
LGGQLFCSAVHKGSTALVAIIALCLAAGAAPAQASVTLGAIPATTPPSTCTNIRQDWLVSKQTTGNSYAVPAVGTITSWSTQTSTTAGQVWTMKIFRHVEDRRYSVVGHDGPRNLTSGKLNTFKTSIPVQPGDLLGMNDNDGSTPVSTACGSSSAGNTTSWNNGSLADGASEIFGSDEPNSRLNIRATFEPQSKFTVSSVARNRKRGTAAITVDLPNPGELTASSAGLKLASASGSTSEAVGAGQTQLLVKAKGKKKRKLVSKGSCKVNVAITYTPADGDARTQHAKFKLIRR